jgi:hypothetical protein
VDLSGISTGFDQSVGIDRLCWRTKRVGNVEVLAVELKHLHAIICARVGHDQAQSAIGYLSMWSFDTYDKVMVLPRASRA